MNLASRFLELLAQYGDTIAIREPGGRTVTYAELQRMIIGLAADLRRRGYQPGDAAVIQAPNGIGFTAATVAIAAVGGVSVLCEPGLGDAIYFSRIASVKPRWALVDPAVSWSNRIPGARRFLARREVFVPPLLPTSADHRRVMISNKILARLVAPPGAEAEIEAVEPRDDATVIFTGGTTSMPKGVRLSHEAVYRGLSAIAQFGTVRVGGSFVADTPQQVFYGLVFGKEVLITRGRIGRRAAMVREMIEAGRAEAYFGSPFLWMEMMAQAGPQRQRLPAALRAVFLGGAPVTPEFLRTLKGWLHPETYVTAIYGLTEAGAVAIASAEEKLAWTGAGDFVGRLAPDVSARISESGEIIVDSPSLFTGYVGQSELAPGAGFPTGDLGEIIEKDGQTALVLLGRAKDMIIRAGVNIYPSTLEAGLRAVTDDGGTRLLREAALIGVWDEQRQDEVVVLYWQPMAGASVDEAVVRKRIEVVTGADARPDHLFKIDPIPVTGRQNKVDKAKLRAMAAERLGLSPTPRGQVAR